MEQKYKITIETSDDFLNFSHQLEDADGDDIDPIVRIINILHTMVLEKVNTLVVLHQTPWIMSQEISGSRYELFKFCTRSFGKDANREIKVGIYNVKHLVHLTEQNTEHLVLLFVVLVTTIKHKMLLKILEM